MAITMAVRPSQGSGKGNLTGSFRVLNDLVVTFYNTVQNLRSSVIDGVHALQKVQTAGEKKDAKEKRCEIVGTIIETLEKQVAELEEIQNKLGNLAKLNADKPSGCRTWTYDSLVSAVAKIVQAHRKETALRRRCVTGMDNKTAEELEVVVPIWLYANVVDFRIEALLETLLMECMLKY